jgi:hypothetical protein
MFPTAIKITHWNIKEQFKLMTVRKLSLLQGDNFKHKQNALPHQSEHIDPHPSGPVEV